MSSVRCFKQKAKPWMALGAEEWLWRLFLHTLVVWRDASIRTPIKPHFCSQAWNQQCLQLTRHLVDTTLYPCAAHCRLSGPSQATSPARPHHPLLHCLPRGPGLQAHIRDTPGPPLALPRSFTSVFHAPHGSTHAPPVLPRTSAHKDGLHS